MSVENQKIIIIHKDKVKGSFMQLELSKMYAASCQLNESQFKLYMYLCGNADNFHLELSQARFMACMGIKRTAYYSAVEGLIKKGYLVKKSGNTYDFYTTPIEVVETKEPVFIYFDSPQNEQTCSENEQSCSQNEQNCSQSDGEIDKYIITDNNREIAATPQGVAGMSEEEQKAAMLLMLKVIETSNRVEEVRHFLLGAKKKGYSTAAKYGYVKEVYDALERAARV